MVGCLWSRRPIHPPVELPCEGAPGQLEDCIKFLAAVGGGQVTGAPVGPPPLTGHRLLAAIAPTGAGFARTGAPLQTLDALFSGSNHRQPRRLLQPALCSLGLNSSHFIANTRGHETTLPPRPCLYGFH